MGYVITQLAATGRAEPSEPPTMDASRAFAGLTPQHRAQFRRDGFAVFESAIPLPLVERLRTTCATVRELARSTNPQAQRLQPVQREDLDQAAFVEYSELAPLRAAVSDLLSQDHGFGDRSVFGVLIEPRDAPYAT